MNDYIGKKYGRLTIVEYVEFTECKCLCECGEMTYQRLTVLKSGHVKSCGCLQIESVHEMNARVNEGGTKNYPFTRKSRKDSSTDLRGVTKYVQNNKTKYAVRLYFKGTEYRKRGFLNIEEALEYRKYLEDTYLPEEKRPK